MYIPTKKYNTGNGVVFQWLLCIALAFVLFCIHICAGAAKIWSFTLLSGIVWSAGNATVVPIVKRIGMGVGMLIWSMVAMLMGWATFRFGFFGIIPEEPHNNTLNIIGVIFTTLSVAAFAFIQPSSTSTSQDSGARSGNEVSHDTEQNVTESTGDNDPLLQQRPVSVQHSRSSQILQRIIGVLLSFLAGVLYGVAFVPIFHVMENYDGASKRAVDYLAAFGLGAFLGSTTLLLVYLMWQRLRKNLTCFTQNEENPEIEPNSGETPFLVLFLPSMMAGTLCAIGQACGLVSAEALQPAISGPISGTLPGALATLIGAVFYGEVRAAHLLHHVLAVDAVKSFHQTEVQPILRVVVDKSLRFQMICVSQ
ncbi:hypothetical protein Aperf_G00000070554 [Anoplocephala perfoliata]